MSIREYYIKRLKERREIEEMTEREFNLETIEIDGITFTNVPAHRNGNSFGITLSTSAQLRALLNRNLGKSVVDFAEEIHRLEVLPKLEI